MAIYSFSKTKIDRNKYISASLLYGIVVYSVRFLPISYGVHSIMNISIVIFISAKINKIDIIDSIKAVIAIFIIQFATEGISIFIIQNIMQRDTNYIFNDPILKVLYGVPSLFIAIFIVIVYYLILKKKGKLKNV